MEPLVIRPETNFIMIGERTNITGSKKFARLIKSGDFEAALAVARDQVEGGANILDVNMDEGLIDGEQAMTRFLNLISTDESIAKIPMMVDSSKWSVIEAGLKCVQGKSVVNSISLKGGEEEFLRQARLVRNYGAAVVVMAFDEQGQAVTRDHKVAICQRAYKLLTEQAGFPPEDIIFDANILTVGTGIEEHNNYAVEFIEAVRELKRVLPYCKTSGGVSNVSFSYRGNDTVREAMNAAFLYHAISAGLDMGIVNAGQLAVYEEIPKDLLEKVEDVLLNRRPDAADRLTEFAESVKKSKSKDRGKELAWREAPVADRLKHALITGTVDFIEADTEEARQALRANPVDHRRPLDGRHERRRRPLRRGQDVPAPGRQDARVMKKAVAYLTPFMEAEKAKAAAAAGNGSGNGHAAHEHKTRGRILMATVKGDVHDIGKNIVGVVLACNDYEVIDLGVMIPCEEIFRQARERKVDMIGLSGLITPSLDEMVHVARSMEREGFEIPLLIGGATTSAGTRRSRSRRSITGSSSTSKTPPRASASSIDWDAPTPAPSSTPRTARRRSASATPSASACSASWSRTPRPSTAASRSTGTRPRSPFPRSWVPVRSRRFRSRRSCRSSIGPRSSCRGSSRGSIPRSSTTPSSARGPASSSTTPRSCCGRSSPRSA